MTNDIIVVVPPGTRVRYVENAYTDDKVLLIDAKALRPHRIEPDSESWLGQDGQHFGLPVYDAEKFDGS